MIRQLQDPKSEGHTQFKKATRQVARLPIDQLVGALNEHVSPAQQPSWWFLGLGRHARGCRVAP